MLIWSKGKRHKFITVARGAWDDKRKKINGLTIFFVCPVTLNVCRIPIALMPPLGAASMDICRTSILGLDRVGVNREDLYHAANDDCVIAVKAGRL